MYAASSPRKAINDIIHNIRQIASNISKDVSSSPQPFQSQPLQDQYPPQRPQTSNYLQDAIEIRNATSTRATVNVEESNLVTQNTSGLAQGIKNAHTKIDQALRFMNDMKSRLEPDRKCFSVNALPSGNKEDMDIKNAQLSYPKSLPILTQTTQETPSLTTLPMAYDELRSSPTNATPTYFAQYDTSRFNPFSKPVVNNMTEMLNLLEQKSVSSNATTQNLMGSIGTANALNFNSSRSIGQMMQSQITSLPRKIPAVPSYMTVNNVAPTGNVDLQRKLLTAASSRPSSANPLQPGCDYNRLNQIVHNIKQKGASQQQLSLNELGSIHSLTSLHDQAAMEYDMMRPNTVSHISTRPPVSTKGFAFPRENNFYQLPQAQYEAVPSHFSSQASMYANNGFRPNTATSGFLEAVQKATNQLSEGEPSENRYSENHEEDEEFCKPRKLKFEKEKVERNHSRKRIAQHQEEKPVKKRQAEVTQKHRKGPSYQHKPHKVRDTQEIYEKRNNYRDVVQEDDSDSLVDESVVVVCHSRKREPSCHHESCASIQSDDESMEESVRYEIPRGKTVTQRTIETKRSICANCHCKKVAKQYIVYNTNTSSGRVVRPKRSLSRKQKCSIEEPKVVFDENVTTYESEAHESRTQTLRRNKSIDCNRVRDSMGRKPLGRPRVVNNENAATADTWTLSKFQKEDQSGKISFESLRRQDENQTNERRYTDHKVNLIRGGARESPNQIYSKVFVDQLALEFPAAKENVTFTNNRVRKTEIIRSNSKVQRRIPY